MKKTAGHEVMRMHKIYNSCILTREVITHTYTLTKQRGEV